MNRMLRYRLAGVSIALIVAGFFAATQCYAWVILSTIGKGEVSSMVSGDTREILLKVPPLGGREVHGNWHSCTLYYRGTQESLQELIDDLHAVPANDLTVTIDRSGKPGREEANLANKLHRSIVYQFSVHVAQLPSAPRKLRISVHVHACGGIVADKICIPDAANKVQHHSMPIRKSTDPTRPTEVVMPNKIEWELPFVKMPILP
ncbi:MAG: hypothetical protein WBD20_20580 [Pirellulaceae bacterium]